MSPRCHESSAMVQTHEICNPPSSSRAASNVFFLTPALTLSCHLKLQVQARPGSFFFFSGESHDVGTHRN